MACAFWLNGYVETQSPYADHAEETDLVDFSDWLTTAVLASTSPLDEGDFDDIAGQ